MNLLREYIRTMILEKEVRGQKSKRTLYHIGRRPASPKPAERWGAKGKEGWSRDWIEGPVKSGVFLTPNPTDIAWNHGVSGNVYAYKVPHWVIEKSGGVNRFDTGSEVLISQEIWDEAGDEIEFLGKTMDKDELWDKVDSSNYSAKQKKGVRGPHSHKKGASLEGLRATSNPEAVIKMMAPEEIEKALGQLATKYEVKPDEIITWPNARKGLKIPHFQQKPDEKDQRLLDLLNKHMKESIVRQYVRSLLLEDEAGRKQLAKDLAAAGTKENNPTPSVYATDEEHVELVKQARSQGRDLKKAFAKSADRAFLDSLVTVHWFRDPQTMKQFLKGSFSSKDELSASVYLPGEVKGAGKFGDYGILIKGYITLLANDMDQLYTGGTLAYEEVFPDMKKQSGINKGVQSTYDPEAYEEYKILVLDKEDWDPSFGGFRSTQNNEALVDNWTPMALIVPDGPLSRLPPEWNAGSERTEPKVSDTTEAEEWEKLADAAGLDIQVMTHKEFTSRGWA